MAIVLVEDNPADMRLVREAFSECQVPAELRWARSGEEALRLLRSADPATGVDPFDLVLLDLNLPGLSGHEVLAQIKTDPHLLQVPVVVLSSSAAPQDVTRAYAAHANAYVVKPDDFEQFLKLVTQLRSYWLETVLLPGRPDPRLPLPGIPGPTPKEAP